MMQRIYQFFVSRIRNRLLLVLFVVSLPALLGMALYGVYFSRELVIEDAVISQESRVSVQVQSIEAFLQGVREDVLFLSRMDTLQRMLAVKKLNDAWGHEVARDQLAVDFLAFAEVKGIYYQVRFIDATGQEVVRVDSDGEISTLIPDEELQNKVGRYYFDDTMELSVGELMVSPLDLNVEQGEIEVPYKPVIRYATPVWFEGEAAGIVIVNVFAELFLSPLKTMATADETIVLVDESAYYLYHSVDESKRWGRDLKNPNALLYRDYRETRPLFLTDVSVADSAVLKTLDEYLFYEKFSPPGTADYAWFLLSIRSRRVVLAPLLRFEWTMLWGLLVAVMVVMVLGLRLSTSLVRPIQQLEHDALRLGQGDFEISVLSDPELEHRIDEIGSLANTLEQARTDLQRTYVELEAQVEQIERRAVQLQTAGEVAASAVAIRTPEELLTKVVNLISARFGFYHTGVFLLDETQKWAVLHSVSSRGGLRMLERGHRLRVGQQGIVGYVAATGRPRIALDVGEDAVHFMNVDLPDTRSELALPLKVQDAVMGILDVQSVEEAAFDEDDIEILQTLANQVAITLQNARLYQASQEQYETLLRVQGEYSRQAWADMTRTLQGGGYRYDRKALFPAQDFWHPAMMEAVLTKDLVQDVAQPENVALPLLLRDQVIGVINARKPDGTLWSADEVSLLTTVRERVEVALESARFYRDSQQAAAREQLLREISEGVRSAVDVDSVMRIAAQEIGEALGRDVFVYLADELPTQDASSMGNEGTM